MEGECMKPEANELVNSCYGHIYSYLYMMLKNTIDAEDATQETFYRFLSKEPETDSVEEARKYLFRIAANICRNYWKSGWYRRIVPDTEKVLLDEACAEEDRERSLDLMKAMMALPKKYRNPLHLYYFEDLTIAEIAETLSEKESTVKTQLARGRAKLKKELGENYEI